MGWYEFPWDMIWVIEWKKTAVGGLSKFNIIKLLFTLKFQYVLDLNSDSHMLNTHTLANPMPTGADPRQPESPVNQTCMFLQVIFVLDMEFHMVFPRQT